MGGSKAGPGSAIGVLSGTAFVTVCRIPLPCRLLNENVNLKFLLQRTEINRGISSCTPLTSVPLKVLVIYGREVNCGKMRF